MSALQTLERAFELARSGVCANNTDIRRRLKKEGYALVGEHLSAPSVKRQLRDLRNEAHDPLRARDCT